MREPRFAGRVTKYRLSRFFRTYGNLKQLLLPVLQGSHGTLSCTNYMGKLDGIKNRVKNIPEFSDKNYVIAGYIVAALITIAGAFLIYEVITTDALVFKANWNMFKSPLGNLCWIIGFIWAMLWWGKFTHWSATPITKTYDRYGNLKKVEEDYDVSNQMFAKILMPFLGHFVIEPIIYGAIIYYPIQCIIAVVGAIFPYILSLIVLAIIVGAWLFTRTCQFRYRSALLVALGVLFTVAFAWGGYAIGKSVPGSTIQMLVGDTPSSMNSDGNATHVFDDTAAPQGEGDDSDDYYEEGEDDQFEGVGEDGLLGSLPNGTTEYAGEMAGFPIEFIITKSEDTGNIKAVYKNVKYNATMTLEGESLPAMGGDISFIGRDSKDNAWIFDLSGDADNISGTASGDGKNFNVTLHRK